jgi:menaquinone-dependent protoporphyrinogen IX oxidase
MKGAVVFTTRYGSTEQYAGWIAEETGFDLINLNQGKNPALGGYDTILIASPVYAGRMKLASWLQKNWESIRDKNVYVILVCTTPAEGEPMQQIIRNNIPREIFDKIHFFALPGTIQYNKLSWFHKIIFKIVNRLSPKMASEATNIDGIEKENIQPVLEKLGVR